MILASGVVSEIFVIPVKEWTEINKRVGQVLVTAGIKDYITSVLSDYPALLNACEQWQRRTFPGLIANSQALSNYCIQAIADFSDLNNEVKKVIQSGSQILPDSLKQRTIDLLQKFRNDTTPIAEQSNLLSTEIITFLNCNITVDVQMARFKDSLGTFWDPLGDSINKLEAAAGHVTGVWGAITNDIDYTMSLPVTVTIPFIESLNLDVAIASWKHIQEQTLAFPVNMKGQEQYWNNPF